MKKIGILTFHRSYNYGAFMQSYALSCRLKKDFPYATVEIIDYATARMYLNYTTNPISYIFGSKGKKNKPIRCLKNFCKMVLDPVKLKREEKLQNAFNEDIKYLPLSQHRWVTDDFLQFYKDISDQYDVIIAGSDAIWEYKTYPFPNAYFLNYDFGKTKLLSYAASCDRMHYSEVTEEQKDYFKKAFGRYFYLGVRDVSTEMFLNHILKGKRYSHNCDPTVLLDVSSLPKGLDRIKSILEKRGIDLGKPIIGVMGGDLLCKLVRKMFGHKYQIVGLYYYTRHADCFLEDLSPMEWAQVFSLFSVTVTRFFHGSLLSLKNGTPTIATDYWYKVKEDHITKIGDLYHRLDLMDHYFYMPEFRSKESIQIIKDRIEFYIEHPDREKILGALEKEEKSYQSFRNALEACLE